MTITRRMFLTNSAVAVAGAALLRDVLAGDAPGVSGTATGARTRDITIPAPCAARPWSYVALQGPVAPAGRNLAARQDRHVQGRRMASRAPLGSRVPG